MHFVEMPPRTLVLRLPSGINIGSKEGRKTWQPGSTARYAASGPRNGKARSDNLDTAKKRVFLRRLAIASTSNRLKLRKANAISAQAFLVCMIGGAD